MNKLKEIALALLEEWYDSRFEEIQRRDQDHYAPMKNLNELYWERKREIEEASSISE